MQHAVRPETDSIAALVRLEVNIRRPLVNCVEQNFINVLDNRRIFGIGGGGARQRDQLVDEAALDRHRRGGRGEPAGCVGIAQDAEEGERDPGARHDPVDRSRR